MKNTGYVTKIYGERVWVRVDRESSCGGNCVSCKGCPSGAVIVECRADGKVNPGDEVQLIMTTGRFFKSVLVGYVMPIVLMIAGACTGYVVFKSEGASIIGTVGGLVCGLCAAKLITNGNKTGITAVKISNGE